MDQDKHKNIPVCQVCYTTGSGVVLPETNEELTRQWKETAAALREVRQLESLDNPTRPPITVYRENKLSNLQRGLSVEDQKIVERLKELRSNSVDDQNRRRKSEPAEEEVAARLARLRGEVPREEAAQSSAGVFLHKKPETEEELLIRLAKQVDLDSKYEARMTGDINERLAKLRGTSSEPATSATGGSASTGGAGAGQSSASVPDINMQLDEIMDEDEETEEQQIQRIMNQFMAEVALEEKHGRGPDQIQVDEDESTSPPQMQSRSDSDSDDYEILCRICEEKRATLKCKECDNDIFCGACFKEFHIELGERHKSTPIPKH